jgi:hypothetical protein
MTWIILRSDFRKENYVATQVRNMGLDAWVPCQKIASRPAIARRVTAKALVQIKELPLIPKLLFVGGPAIHDREVQSELRTLRHVDRIENGADQRPVILPDNQIAAFRAEIDRENTATLALVAAKSRKQKAKWKSLQDALLELVEGAKAQMEQAA